jgi:hypothetical protein
LVWLGFFGGGAAAKHPSPPPLQTTAHQVEGYPKIETTF